MEKARKIGHNVDTIETSTDILYFKGLLGLAIKAKKDYKGLMKAKIEERIAFHIGVLYGLLKTKLSLLRKEQTDE